MIWLLLILLTPADGQAQTFLGTLTVCADNLDLSALFDKTLRPQNQYTLTFLGDKEILANSQMILSFDSEVSLKLVAPRTVRISKLADNRFRSNRFIVTFSDKTAFLRIQVFGPASGYGIPYVTSVILNDVEICKEPKTGYLDYAIERPEETVLTSLIDDDAVEVVEVTKISPNVDKSCGRRKVVHIELIVLGQPTQPGDWPWHVAILMFDGSSLGFQCGGTLLSKTIVLTAAHCATKDGAPVVSNSLSVVLGKYNLHGGDIAAQERRVFEVIVHSAFDVKTLNNDIALLRLKSEAVFDDYVQPACLWHTGLPTEELFGTGSVAKWQNGTHNYEGCVLTGTGDSLRCIDMINMRFKVVGWGFNHQDKLSLTLQQITIPIVSELTCLKSEPIFFQRRLNTNKFCAGFANGTSVCNGDSGGGLMIFVPDRAGSTGKGSGAWYVRGIVSLAPKRADANICDPHHYTIFTDVEKYRDWVMEYLN